MHELRRVDDGVPIKGWTRGVPVEDGAWRQLEGLARMPFVFRHVAAMPDVHIGIGATVGSVVATQGAIIPASVGVDIGCGMMAVRTSRVASDLPTSLQQLRTAIERAVPHGRSGNGGRADRGAWGDVPGAVGNAWAALADGFAQITAREPTCKTVRAGAGDMGIIPGSMGARSFIVRGRGNPDSFCSCSHGAGRRMSRTEAKKRITLAEHRAATEGVECRKDKEVIDESPAAYKDIDAVMAAQQDLVEVIHTLKQVLCVKG